MPNALAQPGVIRSFYGGQDDAMQAQQQNALGQMRQTQFQQQNAQFQQGQDDRAKQQRQQDTLGAIAAVALEKDPARRAGVYGQIVPQLKAQYPDLQAPDQYDEGWFLQALSKSLPQEVVQKIVADNFAAPQSLPNSAQEYQFAVQGGYKGSYQDWMREQKTAVQQYKFENQPAGQGPFDKETGKILARELPKIQQAGISAQSNLVRLSQAETGLDDAVIGPGSGMGLAARRAANYVTGGEAFKGDIQATERVQRILGESALELRNPSGGAGMPGAMSDADREFLMNLAGRIENQTASVQEVMAARKAIERRKIRVAQAANEYIKEKGQLDSGFYAVLEAIGAEPLDTGGGEQQQPQPTPAAPGGFRVIRRK